MMAGLDELSLKVMSDGIKGSLQISTLEPLPIN